MAESVWDGFSEVYSEAHPIAEDFFHLGPNGDPLDVTSQDLALGPEARVLDLGCGAGHNTRVVASRCAEVIAVDSSAAQLTRAQRLTSSDNVCYQQAEISTFLASSPSAAYDLVFSVFGLEYLTDLKSAFAQVRRILRPGGRMLYCDLHPFASCADLVRVTPDSFIRSASYFDETRRPFTWILGDTTADLVRYHRTVSTVLESALRAPFDIVRVWEPQITADGSTQPYHDASITDQWALWSRVPYTLALLLGVK